MSQDIVRQSQRGGPSVDDIWGSQPPSNGLAYPSNAGGGAMGYPAAMPPGGNDVKPLQTIHRSLRGRYKLAILLAAVGAVVGAAAGWKLNNRVYRATGSIRISPVTIYATGNEGTTEYGRMMNSEANSLSSQEIADRAMANPEWQKVAGNRGADAGARVAFLSNLKSLYSGQSYDITVTYDDGNPSVAVAGMNAVLAAYYDLRTNAISEPRLQAVSLFEKRSEELQADIARLNTQSNALERGTLGDLVERSAALNKQLADLERERSDANVRLQKMDIIKQRFVATPQPLDYKILTQREPFFGRLIAVRDDLVTQLTQLQQLRGPNNPVVQNLQSQLNSINQRVQQYADLLSKGYYGVLYPSGGVGNLIEVSDAQIADDQGAVAMLDSQIAELQKTISSVVGQRVSAKELADQIKVKTDQYNDNQNRLQQAQVRTAALTAPFRVIPNPAPAIAEDKRATMATFGFVVGAGLPLAGLVALGLLDRKYRYSDETNASSVTRGIPLLGILPNLPDRLSDPSQASVAAHCVHQIRTMLQLNAVNAEGPTVLSVTSATSGDGKTSLSLALGLSFAASGSRTLLIDSDLIGGGLSNRLGIREPHGISEAILARNPMEFVRDTDVADLSILPVGVNGPQNASAFSPNAVRRLLGEMRKHFDLILIDTGPVLGSIEATPIVASSDSVILTASRGQNRDLVEKAIQQLRNAGARIAGFVFNRANAKDFDRSISGISLRSASQPRGNPNVAGQSANGQYQDNRLGPLVHSVRGTREDV